MTDAASGWLGIGAIDDGNTIDDPARRAIGAFAGVEIFLNNRMGGAR